MDVERLEALYSAGAWPEDPRDPRAARRLHAYIEAFTRILSRLESLGAGLPRLVRVLDVAAGTGVGGAAAACALERLGRVAELHLLDLRASRLAAVEDWLRAAGCRAPWVAAAADALRAHRMLRPVYHLVLVTGSTMTHFAPWEAVRLIAALSRLQAPRGALIVTQRDNAAWYMMRGGYPEVSVAGAERGGEAVLLAVHGGYDQVRGSIRTLYYRLPGGEHIATAELHPWFVSTLAAITNIFYRRVYVEPAPPNTEAIIAALEPRRDAPSPEELGEGPARL